MNRRMFVFSLLAFSANVALAVDTKIKKFKFRIKTKDKSIINTVIEGQDLDWAKSKLQRRYPQCEILSAKQL